ncbi:uncharacterized protein [Ptychodera flava]|uniref:uncharacterized protein n=1 Tax=Ptychodera flava TaxID=63121 RepID=UPI00396A3201
MVSDATDYCHRCKRCTLAKAGKRLHPTMGSLTAKKPLEVLAMDFNRFRTWYQREPSLPVDHLLGIEVDADDNSQVEEWIAEHHQKLMDAYDMASKKTEREALRRRARNDRKADKTDLPVGARVFLRNRNTRGRNKIQDVWSPEPYIVVDRLDTGGNTYVVEPVDGGRPKKTVHRGEMLDSRSLAKDMELDSTPTDVVKSEDTSCSESDDDEFDYGVDCMRWEQLCSASPEAVPDQTGNPEEKVISTCGSEPSTSVKAGKQPSDKNTHSSAQPGTEEVVKNLTDKVDIRQSPEPLPTEEETVGLRRTSRENAGCHSNPFHLPKSAVKESTVAFQIDSQVLTNIAQSNLLIMHMISQTKCN